MSLLDDVRAAERVVSDLTDGELQVYIDAAIAEMRRVGVRESLLNQESLAPLAKYAVFMHVKANYGHDDSEFPMWWTRFNQTVLSLVNSSMNECDTDADFMYETGEGASDDPASGAEGGSDGTSDGDGTDGP